MALSASKHPVFLTVTLHSLRQCATQVCVEAGVEVAVVAKAGGWRSNSWYNYVIRFFGRPFDTYISIWLSIKVMTARCLSHFDKSLMQSRI